MSKGKALGLTILCGVFCVIFLFTPLYGCVFPFLIVGLVFGLIAYRKHQRDTNIITEAYQQQATTSRQLPEPAMTSKGSTRLFVPPL